MKYFYVALILTFSTSIQAITVTWNGDGDGFSWSDKDNWDINSLPQSGDNVIVGIGASTNVNVPITINSLRMIGNADVTVNIGMQLTLGGSFTQALLVSSGSTLLVQGTLLIPSHTGNGIVVNTGGVITNDNVAQITVSNIMFPGKGIINSGTINNDKGTIKIENVTGNDALENLGTINNNDIIDIDNISNGMGISNESSFYNNAGGVITIDDVKNYGIRNGRTFVNYGHITIDDVDKGSPVIDMAGVYNKTHPLGSEFNNIGNLIIKNLVNISGVNVRGIHNESLFRNSGGSITISSISASNFSIDGIRNSGDFRNLSGATLSISNLTGYGNGIYNESEFLNGTNASIAVSDINQNTSVNITNGVVNTATSNFFNNEGKLSITNVADDALVNQNIFTNSDSLIIDEFGFSGIDSDVSFTNQLGGYIFINDGSKGISNDQLFTNLGEIEGDNLTTCYTGENLVNSGTMTFNGCRTINENNLTNSGTFEMTNAIQGIENEDSLVNLAGGNIIVQSVIGPFIRGTIHNNLDCRLINHGNISLTGGREGIHNEGMIINHDFIKIDSPTKIGIGIQLGVSGVAKDTTIINHSTGTIEITNMPALGVEMALEVETEIINDGTIRIRTYLANHASSQGAIINTGMIRNNGVLRVENTSGNYFRGLWNQSNAHVLNNGTIFFGQSNILNENVITNNASMSVSDNLTIGPYAHGIINQDTFINNGTLTCMYNSAFINNHVFTNSTSGQIYFLYLATSLENNGFCQNDGLLEVLETESGIINNDTFINSATGTIDMEDVDIHMIENKAGKYFENQGDIIGLGIVSNAIENDGRIDHKSGSISLSDIGYNAFLNQDTFLISAGADFMVDGVTGSVNLAVSNTGFWDNKGTMTVSNCNNTGLGNGGDFENFGSIIINPNLTDASFYSGFRNSSQFTIHPSAVLQVNRIFGMEPAIYNSGTMINQNEVSIETAENDGLENAGVFHNYDQLWIDGVEETGIVNIDSIVNYSGALIRVRNISNTSSMKRGILNSEGFGTDDETIINNGKIEIEDVNAGFGLGFVNSGKLINNDAIEITNAITGFSNLFTIPFTNEGDIIINASQNGIDNQSPLINNGSIVMDDISADGLINRDSLTNNSLISLTSVGEDAIINQHSSFPHTGYFLNSSAGQINLTDVNRGLYAQGSNPTLSEFFNHGLLSINDVDELAISLRPFGRMENFGSIEIDNVYAGLNAGYVFYNRTGANLTITNHYGNGLNDYGIRIGSTFINESCATIEFEGILSTPFISGTPIIHNYGAIIQYETDDNQIIENLFNAGIYSNVLGANTDTFKITGMGMYIDPILGNYSCGDMVNNFYRIFGTGITGNTLYADPLGSTIAGTMNIPSKTLSLNNQSQSLDVFWGEMTVGGCSYFIPIGFENVVTSCSGPCGINTWKVSAATDNWFTSSNWSENAVPTNCQEVIIPNGSTCTIPTGMTGECKLIEVEVGVNFTVNGLLDVGG